MCTNLALQQTPENNENTLIVDTEVVDFPHRATEVVRIGHKVLARSRASSTVKVGSTTRKISAESNVEDERLIREELAHRARVGREERVWSAPRIRIGRLAGNILGDVFASKVPDADTLLVPQGRIDGSTGAIQTETIAFRTGVLDPATGVEIYTGVADG